MNFLTGITNLTSWMGNVIMPTLAALFFALGVLRYAHGQAHTYAPWAGFLCLMVSGVLRGIEKFAAQTAWNNPDLVWITLRGMVNWTCNVLLPVYAVLQLLQASCCTRALVTASTPEVHGCGISAPRHYAWRYPACCGWRNGSSREGWAALAE